MKHRRNMATPQRGCMDWGRRQVSLVAAGPRPPPQVPPIQRRAAVHHKEALRFPTPAVSCPPPRSAPSSSPCAFVRPRATHGTCYVFALRSPEDPQLRRKRDAGAREDNRSYCTAEASEKEQLLRHSKELASPPRSRHPLSMPFRLHHAFRAMPVIDVSPLMFLQSPLRSLYIAPEASETSSARSQAPEAAVSMARTCASNHKRRTLHHAQNS